MIDADDPESKIAALLGADRIRAPRNAETAAARVIATPRDAAETAEIVRDCEAHGISLAAVGTARILAEIRRDPVAVGISFERMAQIIDYQPGDMTFVAQPGLTVAQANAAMASAGQRLPIDPRRPDETTLGSLIAANYAGPIRISEGTVRDLLIGIRFAGHGGRIIRNGGRVVKNVAGYDLMKLMIGSFGTIGIITEAAFKVRPIPREYSIALSTHAQFYKACELALAIGDSAPLAHLEILSPRVSAALGHPPTYCIVAGFAGTHAETVSLREKIARVAGAAAEFRDGADAAQLYAAERDLSFSDYAVVARIAAPRTSLAGILESCDAEFRAHTECGVAQIASNRPDSAEAACAQVRRWRDLTHAAHGYLRVLHVRAEFRTAVDYFDTPAARALELMRTLKHAFDPAGVFNPGCFVGGI